MPGGCPRRAEKEETYHHLIPVRLVRFDPPLPFTVVLPLAVRRSRRPTPRPDHHLGRERRRQAAVVEDRAAQARVTVQDVVRRLDLGLGRGEERGVTFFSFLGVGAEREERFVPATVRGVVLRSILLAIDSFGLLFYESGALTLSPCAYFAASLAPARP